MRLHWPLRERQVAPEPPRRAAPPALPPPLALLLRQLVVLSALVNVLAFPVLLAFDGAVSSRLPAWHALLWALDGALWLDAAAACRSARRRRLAYELLARLPWDALLPSAEGRAAFGYAHLARLLLAPHALAALNDPFGHRSREARVFVSPSRQLASLMFASALCLHWYSCVVWWVGVRVEAEGKPSWLLLSGRAPQWALWPWWARYARACDLALLAVVGEGVRGESHEEAALGLLGRLGGIVWLAYFTSKMLSLVGTLKQRYLRSFEKISAVQTFCSHAALSPQLHARVQAHLEHVLLRRKLEFDWRALLAELSEPLRAEVALERCRAFFLHKRTAELLGTLITKPHFVKLLATRLEHVAFSPGDFCIEEGEVGQEMFFLTAGRVQVVSRQVLLAQLGPGECFGEAALVVPRAVRSASAVAAGFSEALKLRRDHFHELALRFPPLAARLRALAEARPAPRRAAAAAAAGGVAVPTASAFAAVAVEAMRGAREAAAARDAPRASRRRFAVAAARVVALERMRRASCRCRPSASAAEPRAAASATLVEPLDALDEMNDARAAPQIVDLDESAAQRYEAGASTSPPREGRGD